MVENNINTIPDKQAICDELMAAAENDKDVVVLCSDSRGSGSMTAFAQEYPQQFVEVGIAEQNLVSISAGMAACGKKPYAVSPACFLTTRSYEQIKIDVAYSNTNVKLIGISGGVSYGALGMSHHSLQDIAAVSAIPNMRVYLPSDRNQTKRLVKELLKDNKPAYIRVGRNAVPDIYKEDDYTFELNKANVITDDGTILILACGEMVYHALKASERLNAEGIKMSVIDMYCVKPIDKELIIKKAAGASAVITVEEHSPYGGMGSMVSQIVAENFDIPVFNMSLPDEAVVSGRSDEVFEYYGIDSNGIYKRVKDLVKDGRIHTGH